MSLLRTRKAVYVGAGTDLIPVFLLAADTREFIMIDSQPFSRHGRRMHTSAPTVTEANSKEEQQREFLLAATATATKNKFLLKLHAVMTQNAFSKSDHDHRAGIIEYYNPFTDQTVRYFYNCPFPEFASPRLWEEIGTCDTLYLAGYDPHRLVLDTMMAAAAAAALAPAAPIRIVTHQHTCYRHQDGNSLDARDSTFETLWNGWTSVGGGARGGSSDDDIFEYLQFCEKREWRYWDPCHMLSSSVRANHTTISLPTFRDVENHRGSRLHPKMNNVHRATC